MTSLRRPPATPDNHRAPALPSRPRAGATSSAGLSFRALVAISRPLFWFNTAVPYVWGWLLSGRRLDWPTVLLVAYFTFPYNLLLHGVNDIFDYESDRLNARKDSAEGALLVHPDNFRALTWRIVAWNLPGLLAILAIRSAPVLLAFAALLALSVAYSAPPRLKGRPGLDSLANVLYAGSLLVSALANRVAPAPWSAVGAFALWAIASHAFTAVQDIPADRAAGVRTVALKVDSIAEFERAAALTANERQRAALLERAAACAVPH